MLNVLLRKIDKMKEKILFITAFVPHRAAAGEKNTMIMINDFASKYDVDLIYYKYDYNDSYIPERENVSVVLEVANSLPRKLFGILNYPFIHPFFSIRFSWAMCRTIKKLCKENNYKAVVLNHSYTFLFGKKVLNDIPKILMCHDVIMQRISRSSNKFMTNICKFSENYVLHQNKAQIFSVSQKDSNMITDLYGVPAGVALAYIDELILKKEPTAQENYFTLMSDWTRKENIDGAMWLINEVLPKIEFDICIKVMGRAFPNDIKIHNPHVKFEVLGFVDDPYQIICNSKAMLAPLFNGAGTKQKIIETLACGSPAIGTEIAFEGLPVEFNEYMKLCHNADDFITHMKTISLSLEEKKELKNNFIRCYKKDSITNALDNI